MKPHALAVVLVVVTLASCGPSKPVAEDGGTTTTVGDATTGSGSGGDGDGDGGGDGDGDGTGEKLDMGPPPDIMLDDCTVMWTDPTTLDVYPDCPIVLDNSWCVDELYWGCVPPPPGQTCAQLCPGGDCIADWYNCVDDWPATPPVGPIAVCGPYELDGLCCTLADFQQCPITTNAL